MMTRQEITVNALSGGSLYPLNNIDGWTLVVVDGLGLTEVNRLTQRGPFQDGDTDLGYRRQPRFITLGWEIEGCRNVDLWRLRGCLQQIFRPREDDDIKLNFYLPHGAARSADVNLVGGLDFVTADRHDGRHWRVSAVVKASDPRLYNPQAKTATFQLISSTGGWDIEQIAAMSPWANDTGWDVAQTAGITGSGWNIGAGVLSTSKSITYSPTELCDVPDFELPIITIYGPITNPLIVNMTTNEKLDFSNEGGLVVAAGETVTIDLRYGYKTIVDQTGAAVDQYLTEDSDLFSWHFAYESELLPDGSRATGANLIGVTGSNVTLATKIVFDYYDRYAGV